MTDQDNSDRLWLALPAESEVDKVRSQETRKR